jgi:hypothetical protein
MTEFFRPEAKRLVLRWAESAALAGAFGFIVLYILFWGGFAGWVKWTLGLSVGLVGIWLTRSAILSALSAQDVGAPGLVTIDERRIAYFGPHIGGVISLNDIHTIEIATQAPEYWQYEAQWILRWSETEGALVIPASAEGASGLVDAFAALPGFAPTRALAALASGPGRTITIWRRPGSSAPSTLEQLPPRA